MKGKTAAITQKIENLARQYTPAWSYGAKGDVGTIFAQLFAENMSENMELFEEFLKRHYIFYLNMYDISLRPCCSAEGYITFDITASEGVIVKKGTRIGNSEGTEYETTEDFCAIKPVILNSVYCCKGFLSEGNVANSMSLFDRSLDNMQKNSITFGKHGVLESANGMDIKVNLYDLTARNNMQTYLSDDVCEGITWEYLLESGTRVIDKVSREKDTFTLHIEEQLPVTEYRGIQNIWLRCNFPENTRLPKLSRRMISLSSVNSDVKPESLYLNDTELAKQEVFIFGEEFNLYDSLYIRSNECLSKAGSVISLTLDIDFEEYEVKNEVVQNVVWKSVMSRNRFEQKEPHRIYIERVIWEYWNEKGWSRLFPDDEYSDIFSRGQQGKAIISFICPSDAGSVYIGADSGLFIRCRILKITPGYYSRYIHIAPVLRSISFSYDYKGTRSFPDIIFAEHDMTATELDDEMYTPEYITDENDAMYICFDKPLPCGVVKVFFELVEHACGNRVFRWEYLVNDGLHSVWSEIHIIDETRSFSKSGIVSANVIEPMAEKSMFSTKGFWIRIVSEKPMQDAIRFKRIVFNTVRIRQVERHEEELFTVLANESSKQCKLSGENVLSAEVMVRENSSKNNWVRWKETDYKLDYNKGIVEFESVDGKKMPPAFDEPTIKISYTTTSGSKGNQPENSITQLLTPVPFTDRIYNCDRIFGGYDTEELDEAIRRGSEKKVCLDRCICTEDYESFARSYSKSVNRVKCMEKDQSILLVVLTDEKEKNGFEGLCNELKMQINDRMPFYLQKLLQIKRAGYIHVCISARIRISSVSEYQTVIERAEGTLKNFLDPVNGNVSGEGYDIGEFPSPVKIHEHLKTAVSGTLLSEYRVCYVLEENGFVRELSFEEMEHYECYVPCNGHHTFVIEEG